VWAFVGSIQNLKDLNASWILEILYCNPDCGSFLRKGEMFAYVGLCKNLKDPMDTFTHQVKDTFKPCSTELILH